MPPPPPGRSAKDPSSELESWLPAALERARGHFRQDVADQLRMAAAKAGLDATVTLDPERAVLEFHGTLSHGDLPQVITAFNDEPGGQSSAGEQLTLLAELAGERATLLTLVWRADPGLDEAPALQRLLAELEARTDERLPLSRRGLNASADARSGRCARSGDAIRQLAADIKRAAG